MGARRSFRMIDLFHALRKNWIPVPARVVSVEKEKDQYRLIVDLDNPGFPGDFDDLRFRKNPYAGALSKTPKRSCVTLVYRKDPGVKAGEIFPLWAKLRENA
ncbi:MAG TPA: hypothetical protein VE641_18285 [Chthoniobacterales bacterium]|nr:hypothetical protein [Chthoniobacterales bacterium]